ncbi:hypothetical protein CLOM_g8995 [Closterium sp. NIES-68]|nr:hypothetical protein CLOM_g8995 [Closterium sp. NIES-68]GJP83959.1 hypothetical protein CLOP_g14058 [Closterium sp. NIES-67]
MLLSDAGFRVQLIMSSPTAIWAHVTTEEEPGNEATPDRCACCNEGVGLGNERAREEKENSARRHLKWLTEKVRPLSQGLDGGSGAPPLQATNSSALPVHTRACCAVHPCQC